MLFRWGGGAGVPPFVPIPPVFPPRPEEGGPAGHVGLGLGADFRKYIDDDDLLVIISSWLIHQ